MRSTNSLDYLFLTRFIHRAYPDAYIVTMGSDLLFGRDVDSTEFRGVVALSAFPLLPRGQDWTLQTPSALAERHAHRIFGSDIMEGVYLAARYLKSDCAAGAGATPCVGKSEANYVHRDKLNFPEYAEPFWLENLSSSKDLTPSTWLSVVGREGYWPLAVLTRNYKDTTVLSNLTKVARPQNAGVNVGLKAAGGWFALSSAWKFLCFLSLLLVSLHFVASRFGWRYQNLGSMVQFSPMLSQRQPALMVVGWGTVCSFVMIVFLASFRLFPWLRFVDQAWVCLIGVCLTVACVAALLDIFRTRSELKALVEKRSLSRLSPLVWLSATVIVVAIATMAGFNIFKGNDGILVAYRSVHLTSGISPVASILLILAGFYWWFWQSLAGLSLLGEGRPTLPRKSHLDPLLSRVSDAMAENIEASAIPLPSTSGDRKWMYLVPLLLLSLQLCVLQRPWVQGFDAVIHSLESRPYSWTLHGLFAIALYLMILDCLQFWFSWSSLKRLLLALNRLPLRRTFAALQGLSMYSLWGMSGVSSRTRYKIFSHQLESLSHLRNELSSFDSRDCGTTTVRTAVHDAFHDGLTFMAGRGEGPDLAMANDEAAKNVRASFSDCAAIIISDVLLKDWFRSRNSLDLAEASRGDKAKDILPLSGSHAVRLAEEFVCLIYVGYLQNLLARMRCMVMSMAGLFALVALSVAFYPFTPRPFLALWLMLLILVLGIVVAVVYAGLDRDSTLSHITNTEPGSLGINFWLRIFSFVGVPALSLLVAQFPEITDFIGSWIEPSLSAVK